MGRYTEASCKLCRREGMKLFLKGDRCYMAKCAIEQGKPAPGQHGARRTRKPSDYGVQLREKQRLRRMYGLQEQPFRLLFARAARKRGVTGEILLQMLEMRLDNVVYRLGFATSRKAARQLVSHGHVHVDGKKASISSISLKPSQVIELRDRKKIREVSSNFIESAESRGIVPWLKLDKASYKGEILHVPSREDINPPVNEQLVVELYSK